MARKTEEKQNKELPELITLKEACKILKVHPNTLRAWDKKGILVAVRLGERKIRKYKVEDIKKLIERQED